MTAFHCAIRKHGLENFVFEHIASAMTHEALQESEKTIIKQLKTLSPNGYNISEGGDGFHGKHSEATKLKRSEALKRYYQNARPDDLEKRRANISKVKKGKKQPWAKETAQRLKGIITRSDEFKFKVSEGMKRHIKEKCSSEEMSRRSYQRKIFSVEID